MARNGRWVEAGLLALGLVGPAAAQASDLPRPDFMGRETAVMCAGLSLAFAEAAEPADAMRLKGEAEDFRRWASEFSANGDLAAEIEARRASFADTVKPSQSTPWSQMMSRLGGAFGQCAGYWMASNVKAAERATATH